MPRAQSARGIVLVVLGLKFYSRCRPNDTKHMTAATHIVAAVISQSPGPGAQAPSLSV